MELKHVLAQHLALLMERRPRLATHLKLESASGVGKSTLQRILNAEVNTDLDKLQKIASAFEVEPFKLLIPLDIAANEESGRNHSGISTHGGVAPEDYTEIELLNAWRRLDDEDRDQVTAFMGALATIANVKIAQSATRKVHEPGKVPVAIVNRAQTKAPKLTQQSNRDNHGKGSTTKKRKGV